VLRELISPLQVWDCAAHATAILKPGALITRFEILKNSNTESDPQADVYLMAFETQGRSYTCPLFRFLPRTHAVAGSAPAEETAPKSVAG
jgi:hypothetical protein